MVKNFVQTKRFSHGKNQISFEAKQEKFDESLIISQFYLIQFASPLKHLHNSGQSR